MKRAQLLFFSLMFLCLTACYKEKTTMVTVKVATTGGIPVSAAQVRLYAEPTSNSSAEIVSDYTKVTNGAGEAYFNLTNLYEPGQNGVGVLRLKGQYQNLTGEDIIVVEQEKNNSIVLTLQ
jgi:hypothetical protein